MMSIPTSAISSDPTTTASRLKIRTYPNHVVVELQLYLRSAGRTRSTE